MDGKKKNKNECESLAEQLRLRAPPPLTQIVRRDERVHRRVEGISDPVKVKPAGLKVLPEKQTTGDK